MSISIGGQSGSEATWIQVSRDNELTEEDLRGFVAQLQAFIDAQGMRVAGETEAAGGQSTAVARKSVVTAAVGKASQIGRALDVLGMVTMISYMLFMAAIFVAMAVPVLRAEGEDAGFSVASPLAAILTCLLAGAIAEIFPRSIMAWGIIALGAVQVILNNYRIFEHHHPLNNLPAWTLMAMTILCETAAFICTPQVVYRLSRARQSRFSRADPA